MALTIFYLYGLVYIIRDMLQTYESVTTDAYEKGNKQVTELHNAVSERDVSGLLKIKESNSQQMKWYNVILALFSAFWLIGGLKTELWQHFMFLLIIAPLPTILQLLPSASSEKIKQYKAIEILGTALNIGIIGIIYYKHFYLNVTQ